MREKKKKRERERVDDFFLEGVESKQHRLFCFCFVFGGS